MFSSELQELMRPSHAAILAAIKRSDGLSVAEIARQLGRSYMGIKQHCVALEKKGYLKVWRVPRQQVGRPLMLYQLTAKCDSLFPGPGPLALHLLEASKGFLGESGPEKMLFHYFQRCQDRWQKAAGKGPLPEKTRRLAAALEQEGRFLSAEEESGGSLLLHEHHNPLAALFAAYPSARQMEAKALSQALGATARLTETTTPRGQSLAGYRIS